MMLKMFVGLFCGMVSLDEKMFIDFGGICVVIVFDLKLFLVFLSCVMLIGFEFLVILVLSRFLVILEKLCLLVWLMILSSVLNWLVVVVFIMNLLFDSYVGIVFVFGLLGLLI